MSAILSWTPSCAPSAGISRLTVPPASPCATRRSDASALSAATSMPAMPAAPMPSAVPRWMSSLRLRAPDASASAKPGSRWKSFTVPSVGMKFRAGRRRPPPPLSWNALVACRCLLADGAGEQGESFDSIEFGTGDGSVVGRVVARAAADVGDIERAAAELHVADVVAEALEEALVGAVGANDVHTARQHRGDVQVTVGGGLEPVGDRIRILEDADRLDLAGADVVPLHGARVRLDPDDIAVRLDRDPVGKCLARLGDDLSCAIGIQGEDVAGRRRCRLAEATGRIGEVEPAVRPEREVVGRAQRDAVDLRHELLDLAARRDPLDRGRALIGRAPVAVDAAVLGHE